MSISTTDFTPYPNYVKRYTRRGVSSRPQGLDGVGELTRTAYRDMVDAVWTEDAAQPSVPVHEYDRETPSGDAYRATWGYDAAGRTEQSAAGAVCYTVRLPAGNRPTLTSVSARIVGDRWLGDGARVTVVPSSSSTPPSWDDVLQSSFQSDVVCATDGQTEAPNNRTGVIADVTVGIGETCADYIHIVLRIDDYLTHRKSWVEGGAMLLPDTIEFTFEEDLTYSRGGTHLLPGNDEAVYDGTGNRADAIGVDDERTAFYYVTFPTPNICSFDSIHFFKKGDLFVCKQVSVGSSGVTFNRGHDIIQSTAKYRQARGQATSDGIAYVGKTGGVSDRLFTGFIVVACPAAAGTFKSLAFPALTGDSEWRDTGSVEFEMVVYKAPHGLPPFIPVNGTHSMNDQLCGSMDPFHFPYRAFFDEKNATGIYFSNSSITSVISGDMPAADATALMDIEFVDSWPFVGNPGEIAIENERGQSTTLEYVTEFKFSKPLTITSRQCLVIGVWPRRDAVTNSYRNVMVPHDYDIGLLK